MVDSLVASSKKMTTIQNSILPLVWPSADELAGHAENRSTALFDHMQAKVAQVLGIISALDHRGVDLVEKLVRGESAIEAKIILGDPTPTVTMKPAFRDRPSTGPIHCQASRHRDPKYCRPWT